MIYDYLLTSDGQKIYYEDLEKYFNMKEEFIQKIKLSPKFTQDAINQNFDMYYKILDDLKLSTPDGKKLEDSEVFELRDNGKIGKKKKNSNGNY